MKATPARLAALRIMRHVRGGGLVDPALHSELPGLDPRDRAWTNELVRGTLRLRGRLDHVLSCFTRRPFDRLDADVLDILRLGTYQLLEMHGVPPYAAVSQSVELARRTGAHTFVNAVLQAVRRADGDVPYPDFDRDPAGWLETRGSHPRWLVDRWLSRFGPAATRRLVESNNERPALYLRLIGLDSEPALTRLATAGVGAVAVEGEAGSLRLEEGASVETALAAVPSIVQDPAASRVAVFADPGGGTMVDLCAAPGGKTAVLASRGTSRASPVHVVAADVSQARIRRVADNVRRLDLPVGIVVADGRRPPFRPVDAVLIDAPCTGTGTLRRHADARWRIQPADLDALVSLQAALLDSAAAIVRPGGLLVYATCSIEDEENDGQVEAFLDRNAAFGLEEGPDSRLGRMPQVHGFDGAFAVRLRRRH